MVPTLAVADSGLGIPTSGNGDDVVTAGGPEAGWGNYWAHGTECPQTSIPVTQETRSLMDHAALTLMDYATALSSAVDRIRQGRSDRIRCRISQPLTLGAPDCHVELTPGADHQPHWAKDNKR